MVGKSRKRRYLRSDGLPHYREPQPSKLDPCKQYLAERVKAAAPEWIPATVLLRETRELGSWGNFEKYVQMHRLLKKGNAV